MKTLGTPLHQPRALAAAVGTACASLMAASAALAPQPASATNIVVQPGTTAGYLYFPSTAEQVSQRIADVESRLSGLESRVNALELRDNSTPSPGSTSTQANATPGTGTSANPATSTQANATPGTGTSANPATSTQANATPGTGTSSNPARPTTEQPLADALDRLSGVLGQLETQTPRRTATPPTCPGEVLDVGSYIDPVQLICPINVNGKVYYLLDQNGDGMISSIAGYDRYGDAILADASFGNGAGITGSFMRKYEEHRLATIRGQNSDFIWDHNTETVNGVTMRLPTFFEVRAVIDAMEVQHTIGWGSVFFAAGPNGPILVSKGVTSANLAYTIVEVLQ